MRTNQGQTESARKIARGVWFGLTLLPLPLLLLPWIALAPIGLSYTGIQSIGLPLSAHWTYMSNIDIIYALMITLAPAIAAIASVATAYCSAQPRATFVWPLLTLLAMAALIFMPTTLSVNVQIAPFAIIAIAALFICQQIIIKQLWRRFRHDNSLHQNLAVAMGMRPPRRRRSRRR